MSYFEERDVYSGKLQYSPYSRGIAVRGSTSFTPEYTTIAPITQSINSILSDQVITKMHLLTPQRLIAYLIQLQAQMQDGNSQSQKRYMLTEVFSHIWQFWKLLAADSSSPPKTQATIVVYSFLKRNTSKECR